MHTKNIWEAPPKEKQKAEAENDRNDEGFQMVRHLTRSDAIMMELTRI